ncbi:hypothetical protein D039_2380A, partial [Vibrio parahaemolyticus EKP-028]
MKEFGAYLSSGCINNNSIQQSQSTSKGNI